MIRSLGSSNCPVNARMQRGAACRAITLVESMIAVLILSGLMVAAIQGAALSAAIQMLTAQRSTARMLAQALAADIAQLPYQNPTGVSALGRESGEISTSKLNYNDVDDFNAWTESPPQDKNGNLLAGTAGYKREVSVDWVNPIDLNQPVAAESGVKRVTISVSRGNKVLATHTFIRTATQ